MSSDQFSQHILCVGDLYNAALRNGYFLPKKTSSAITEVMLVNVLKGTYWCPKTDSIRMMNCVRAPVVETLLKILIKLCIEKQLNISWIDATHVPDKKWMVDIVATLDPGNEIFKKDYVAPPIRKRLRDVETIVLPAEVFEGLPPTTSKLKARRLKIMSEAFAAEKASRYKQMQKDLYEQMVAQEQRRDELKKRLMGGAAPNKEEIKRGD
jgi:hypothetical protein